MPVSLVVSHQLVATAVQWQGTPASLRDVQTLLFPGSPLARAGDSTTLRTQQLGVYVTWPGGKYSTPALAWLEVGQWLVRYRALKDAPERVEIIASAEEFEARFGAVALPTAMPQGEPEVPIVPGALRTEAYPASGPAGSDPNDDRFVPPGYAPAPMPGIRVVHRTPTGETIEGQALPAPLVDPSEF